MGGGGRTEVHMGFGKQKAVRIDRPGFTPGASQHVQPTRSR